VAPVSILKSNFSRSCYFEAFFSARVGFNLWHYKFIFILHPAGVSHRRKLMEPYGQYAFRCNGYIMLHKCIMGCKSNAFLQIIKLKRKAYQFSSFFLSVLGKKVSSQCIWFESGPSILLERSSIVSSPKTLPICNAAGR